MTLYIIISRFFDEEHTICATNSEENAIKIITLLNIASRYDETFNLEKIKYLSTIQETLQIKRPQKPGITNKQKQTMSERTKLKMEEYEKALIVHAQLIADCKQEYNKTQYLQPLATIDLLKELNIEVGSLSGYYFLYEPVKII